MTEMDIIKRLAFIVPTSLCSVMSHSNTKPNLIFILIHALTSMYMRLAFNRI